MGRNGGGSSTSLAPGFRFHPTDEELVAYYLRRKVSRKPVRVDAISEIEVYKTEPWDLPGLSKLKTRDLEWYFFSNLDKKYSNGAKTNRATSEGYWKTTGKDRPIRHRSQVLGMKKTLVYHRGRAPRGERTNWVMHEYRLVDEELEKAGVLQESFVLCRIFQKSGSGPKNGERYGAPFVDEEWEADGFEGATLPCEPGAEEVFITDELFTEGNDHDQKHYADLPFEGSYPPLTLYQGDDISFLEDLATNELEPLPAVNEDQLDLETNDDRKFFNLPVQLEFGAVKNEYAVPPTNVMSHIPVNNLPGEQCLDSVNLAPSDDRFYLEADDLSEPVKQNSSDLRLLDEYLACFDAENDITQYLTFDQPDSLDANDNLCDQTFLPDQNLEQGSTSKQELTAPDAYGAESASSSKQVMEAPKSETDVRYPFKQESQMMDCFLAPSPAFTSHFPTKDMAAKLHAAVHSSEPVRVTAGMIRIRDLSMNDNGIHWSLDKRGKVNVVLTFDLPDGIIVNPAGIKAFTSMISQKMTSVISHDWAYFFFSLMLLFITAKFGTCIYAR